MSGSSSIEWTDATWNPVRGCSRVSEGCRNCYAERQAARFSGRVGTLNEVPDVPKMGRFAGFAEQTPAGPRWTGQVKLIPEKLDWPLRWRGDKQARAEGRPSRIFVNSMSDLFHERLSDEEIAAVFGVMAACPQHTFQVLTKRPDRARRWFEWLHNTQTLFGFDRVRSCAKVAHNKSREATINRDLLRLWDGSEVPPSWPLPNVWLGVSVEDQATADERIPLLLRTPAAVRFVSYEPALGAVEFRRAFGSQGPRQTYIEQLDWLIVGGESGPGARPFDLAWARSAVTQCRAAGVACFVKQLGARPCGARSSLSDRVLSGTGFIAFSAWQWRDRKGGDASEWPEDLRVREFPA